jgi:hypothetical protein
VAVGKNPSPNSEITIKQIQNASAEFFFADFFLRIWSQNYEGSNDGCTGTGWILFRIVVRQERRRRENAR